MPDNSKARTRTDKPTPKFAEIADKLKGDDAYASKYRGKPMLGQKTGNGFAMGPGSDFTLENDRGIDIPEKPVNKLPAKTTPTQEILPPQKRLGSAKPRPEPVTLEGKNIQPQYENPTGPFEPVNPSLSITDKGALAPDTASPRMSTSGTPNGRQMFLDKMKTQANTPSPRGRTQPPKGFSAPEPSAGEFTDEVTSGRTPETRAQALDRLRNMKTGSGLGEAPLGDTAPPVEVGFPEQSLHPEQAAKVKSFASDMGQVLKKWGITAPESLSEVLPYVSKMAHVALRVAGPVGAGVAAYEATQNPAAEGDAEDRAKMSQDPNLFGKTKNVPGFLHEVEMGDIREEGDRKAAKIDKMANPTARPIKPEADAGGSYDWMLNHPSAPEQGPIDEVQKTANNAAYDKLLGTGTGNTPPAALEKPTEPPSASMPAAVAQTPEQSPVASPSAIEQAPPQIPTTAPAEAPHPAFAGHPQGAKLAELHTKMTQATGAMKHPSQGDKPLSDADIIGWNAKNNTSFRQEGGTASFQPANGPRQSDGILFVGNQVYMSDGHGGYTAIHSYNK